MPAQFNRFATLEEIEEANKFQNHAIEVMSEFVAAYKRSTWVNQHTLDGNPNLVVFYTFAEAPKITVTIVTLAAYNGVDHPEDEWNHVRLYNTETEEDQFFDLGADIPAFLEALEAEGVALQQLSDQAKQHKLDQLED